MEDKWGTLVIVCIAVSISLAICVVTYTESKVDIEAAKSGLQQCLISNKILWKKECPSLT